MYYIRMIPTCIRPKPKLPACMGGSEVTSGMTEGQIQQEVCMKHDTHGREKQKLWMYVLNIILVTLIHLTLTFGHTLDSLTVDHDRLRLASA
jgi:hypothetical protein